jgi:hypothetical protein
MPRGRVGIGRSESQLQQSVGTAPKRALRVVTSRFRRASRLQRTGARTPVPCTVIRKGAIEGPVGVHLPMD